MRNTGILALLLCLSFALALKPVKRAQANKTHTAARLHNGLMAACRRTSVACGVLGRSFRTNASNAAVNRTSCHDFDPISCQLKVQKFSSCKRSCARVARRHRRRLLSQRKRKASNVSVNATAQAKLTKRRRDDDDDDDEDEEYDDDDEDVEEDDEFEEEDEDDEGEGDIEDDDDAEEEDYDDWLRRNAANHHRLLTQILAQQPQNATIQRCACKSRPSHTILP